MATIEESSDAGQEAFIADLRALDEPGLLAQDLVQQGAVHAISTLLRIGCSEQNAVDMLSSLRNNAALIRAEAARRGKPSLFSHDQVNFN